MRAKMRASPSEPFFLICRAKRPTAPYYTTTASLPVVRASTTSGYMESSRTCARSQCDASLPVWSGLSTAQISSPPSANRQRAGTPPQLVSLWASVQCVGSDLLGHGQSSIWTQLGPNQTLPNGAARVYQGNVSKVRAWLESISSQGIRSFTSAECDLLRRQETTTLTDRLGRLHAASVPHSTDTLSFCPHLPLSYAHKYAVRTRHRSPPASGECISSWTRDKHRPIINQPYATRN